MAEINAHGLSRNIPSEVKRQVRQECGFGCVICGNAIYQYDHFDPEFSGAVAHEARGIALLCPGCHQKKTRKLITNAFIQSKRRDPFSKNAGQSTDILHIEDSDLVVKIGNSSFSWTDVLIKIFNDEILKIEPPADSGGPLLFTASLFDSNEKLILQIVKNEIFVFDSSFDVEYTGRRFKIWSEPRKIDLEMEIDPAGIVSLNRLNMLYRNVLIEAKINGEFVIYQNGSPVYSMDGIDFSDCRVGIDIKVGEVLMGVGGSMLIRSLKIYPHHCDVGWRAKPSSNSRLQLPFPRASPVFRKQKRNELCVCNSGLKYKRCHGRQFKL